MKTDDLIGMLSVGAGPAPTSKTTRTLVPLLATGLVVSAVVSLAARGFVPAAMLSGAAFWTKLAYASALAAGCAWLAVRLSRPASPRGGAVVWICVVVLAMAVVGLAALAGVAPAERVRYLVGGTALVCPWAIPLLGLPTLAGLIWILRDLAPTRPGLAGFAAGLLAGAVGAAGYALSCTEDSIAFIALWYSAGIAVSGALGALAGRRFLRW